MTGRLVVLVSGTGSNLEALIDACRRGEVPASVVAVFADRPCVALGKAEAAGIDAHVVRFEAFSSREAWSAALAEGVGRYRPDVVVSAGFMRITSPVFVDAFAGRLINLHPSLLPAFPGAHAVRDALASGVRVSGSTVHFIDYEVDHGPIILQEAVPVLPDDTEGSLHARIKEVEHHMLPTACRLILEGKVRLSDGRVALTDET